MPNRASAMFRLLAVFQAFLWFLAVDHAAAEEWIPDHIVIVIEENLSYRNLVPELLYLTELMRHHANFTNAHGIDHPSQPNYLALFSGSAQGTGSEAKRNPDGSNPIIDGRTQVGSNEMIKDTPLTTPNLGAALIRSGRSFAGYSEDLPHPGFIGNSHVGPPGSGVDYQRKHNPWANWQAVNDNALGKNQLASTTNLPFSAFPREDAGFANLPTVAIVVPNQINDGHQSSAAPPETNYGQAMDAWLRRNIEPYRRWAMSHNSLLIITWDEDEDDYTPVNDANGKRVAKRYLNHIPTIMAGQGVITGTYDEYIDLYSIPRTIETFYQLQPLASGDTAARIISSPFRKP